jgi:hypothetical protein
VYIGPNAVVATWVVGGRGGPDLAVVDVLARLHLVAHRLGGVVRLAEVSPELAELLDLAGLAALGREVDRQPEGGEEVGIEKGVEPGDPLA